MTAVAVGPGEVRWLEYTADDRVWSAAFLRGQLVQRNQRGWYVLGRELDHVALREQDLDLVRACPPGPDAPPIWPAQAGLIPEDDDESLGRSWQQRDLSEVVAGIRSGTISRPMPTVGRRADGGYLFYPARVNGIQGESGGGKSFLSQYVALQEITAGNHAIYVDLEDDEIGVISRLLAMGGADHDILTRFHYLHPDEPFGPDAAAEIRSLLDLHRPTLVVIDSTGEALALNKVKDIDDEVARWFRTFPRAIANHGPAVVTVDHVTKDRETRGLYAIGSQRKRAAISGASYMIDPIRPMAQGRNGAAKLVVAKDRCGNYPTGVIAAIFTLDATGADLTANLGIAAAGNTTFRPTHLMEKVSRYIELNPGGSKHQIDTAKLGRAEYVRDALQILVTDGSVRAEQVGQAMRHYVVRPYREPSNEPDETA